MIAPDLIIIKRWSGKKIGSSALALFLVLALLIFAGYLFGVRHALEIRNDNQILLQSNLDLATELEAINKQLVMQKQISLVDKAATLQAGTSLDSQYQKIRVLQRELTFFRSIIAPEESSKGLQISRFNWHKSDDGHINWQLSLIQAGSQGRLLSGAARLELVAMRGQQQVTLALKDIKNKLDFKYRFKYFQHLSGSFELAKDLVPISVNVSAKPTIAKQPTIEKQFQWQSDEEKIANVE